MTAMASHLLHVAKAFGLGLVSGGRAAAGPASVLFALNSKRPNRYIRIATPIALLGAAGEVVGDKLPKAPSRLDQPGLSARLVSGAGSAAALTLASKRWSATLLAAGIGAAGAYAGSRLGAAWRGFAAQRLGKDLPGALIEDAATYISAVALTRKAFRAR